MRAGARVGARLMKVNEYESEECERPKLAIFNFFAVSIYRHAVALKFLGLALGFGRSSVSRVQHDISGIM